jgi:hypothetical protein
MKCVAIRQPITRPLVFNTCRRAGCSEGAQLTIFFDACKERHLAQQTNLLLAATIRDGLRWAGERIYALLVLGPLVLGTTYLTLSQITGYDLKLGEPSLGAQILSAAGFVISAIAVSLSRATRELYHLRRPTVFAEALPLARSGHLHFALFLRAGHALLLGAALLLGHTFLSKESMTGESLLVLAIFCGLITVSEMYAAINWIHWGHGQSRPSAIKAVAVLITSTLMNSLLLVLFFNRAAAPGLAEALNLPGHLWARAIVYTAGGGLLLLIYLGARAAHERWRGADIDYAQRLEQRAWPEWRIEGLLRGRLPQRVRALLARDLSLTLRVFSSAVYVAVAISLLIIILLLTLLLSGSLPSVEETLGGLRDFGWMSATWFPAALAIKSATLLVVACLTSIVPVLVAHQIPHVWLERAVGATGNDLWEAKLWYARLMTLPPVIAIYLLGALATITGGAIFPLSYLLPLLAECLWLWWLTSSIAGALAFEMPDRPGLALVLSLSLSLSIGALSVILWPMGLGIYGMGVEQAKERGIMQSARYLMMEEQ